MTTTTAPAWEPKRTDETRMVEDVLRRAGFAQVDTYRQNSASIRVRVIDPRFEGVPMDKRDALVEPHLDTLPEPTQADIMVVFTFAPSEIEQGMSSLRTYFMNSDFESAMPSRL